MKPFMNNKAAVFLTGGHGGWSYEGCIVKESRVNETVCSCNHLTSFAVLMVIIF